MSRKSGFSKCLLNGILTLANGVGSLLLATGVATEVGIAILVINGIVQLFQILGDLLAMLSGDLPKNHFQFNLFLNIADAIPGLGVLSGVFGLMGECVFDWAIGWGSPN